MVERFTGMPNPPIGLGAARRMCQKRGEVALGSRPIAALEEQKREPVVRAAQLRVELERPPVLLEQLPSS